MNPKLPQATVKLRSGIVGFFSNFLKNPNSLNAEFLFENIERSARQIFKSDLQITHDSQWTQLSGKTVYVIGRLENMYLLEREILCLAAAIIQVEEVKNAPEIINNTVNLIIDKYRKLRDHFVNDGVLRSATSYRELINRRLHLYMNEMEQYLTSKSRSASVILFFQYHPLFSTDESSLEMHSSMSGDFIIDDYLELTFRKITLPVLTEQLPASIKI